MRLFTHLSRDLETELIDAVFAAQHNGDREALDALRADHPDITDRDVADVQDELRQGECEGRDCGRDDAFDYEAGAGRYTSTRYADELPEADFYGE